MNPIIDGFASPFLASSLDFAFQKATMEGKITIGVLSAVSLFSWTVIITKIRQLMKARKMSRQFFTAFRETRDPMEIDRKNLDFTGSPAYEVYAGGIEELDYHLKNNAIMLNDQKRISQAAFSSVKIAMERWISTQAMALEKGMIILSTAVAGGPFIGLLGTVWGVMDTFSGVAKANSASLTAMAPGVAGALIATVVGLLVAIPAMFAYNFMVTTIRSITQEVDTFAAEFAMQIEHKYVDNRPLAEEIVDALKQMKALEKDGDILA